MTTPVVSATGLHKSFGGRAGLTAVDLEVAPGEIVGVLGPNGAGKSTLLRALVGLVRPDAGSVRISGVDLATDPRAAKAQVGYVGHERNLLKLLTVSEQLELSAQLYRGQLLDAEREELLDALGLGDDAHTKIGSSSSTSRRSSNGIVARPSTRADWRRSSSGSACS